MSAERRPLTLALLLSLLIHALMSTLTLGGQGLGLPGFGFPWQERRIEVPDLSVRLMPAPITAVQPVGPPAKQPVAVGPAPVRKAQAIKSEAGPTARAMPMTQAKPEPDTAIDATRASAPLRSEGSVDTVPTPIPEPIVTAAAPSASSPETVTPAPRAASDAVQARVDLETRERAVELAKRERAEREAQRQAVQLESARVETARQESARREAERVETTRLEAERQAAAREAAVRQEAVRQEAARQEAARQEAARQEAARQDAVRQEAARQDAARSKVAQEEEARIERRRAMGRQLDEEAARREAASTAAGLPSRLAPSPSGARRARLFGRTDSNAELILYAEAWARKIQLNMTIDMVREAAKRPHTHPLVTVAIRSDGSVESVTFVVSSGVADIDEAIRRIVQSQVPYPAFSPGLAREYDVIEIRRTWHFDMAIRLY